MGREREMHEAILLMGKGDPRYVSAIQEMKEERDKQRLFEGVRRASFPCSLGSLSWSQQIRCMPWFDALFSEEGVIEKIGDDGKDSPTREKTRDQGGLGEQLGLE